MSVKATAVSVTTSATRLDTVDDTADRQAGQSCAVYNNGAVIVYLGGSDVATASGVPVAAGSWGPSFDLATGDGLYGIVGSGTCDVRVLETGV